MHETMRLKSFCVVSIYLHKQWFTSKSFSCHIFDKIILFIQEVDSFDYSPHTAVVIMYKIIICMPIGPYGLVIQGCGSCQGFFNWVFHFNPISNHGRFCSHLIWIVCILKAPVRERERCINLMDKCCKVRIWIALIIPHIQLWQ